MSIINNGGGMPNPGRILESMLFVKGILYKIFGNLHDDLLYDQDAKWIVNYLENIHGWKDVNEYFYPLVDRVEIDDQMKNIFKIANVQESGILGNK
jgi:hypothetical protein